MSALAVATGPADREIDDLDLVAAVRAGDERAFETLFLRYRSPIVAYVRRKVGDHGRAEDITQEVFMSALRRLREDDVRQIHFRPWIYEIAKNKCIDAHRRDGHTSEVSFDAHDELGAAEHDRVARPASTPDSVVEGKIAFDNLCGAFGDLSPAHRDILVMREFEGLSYREIGERLGISSGAVDGLLARARKCLEADHEELATGRRCLRVQRVVEDSGIRPGRLRDQRLVARHLSYCQPCRRHAYLAGADLADLVRPASSLGARVAAFLPLPMFLRRRWSRDDVSQILNQQAGRPAAQWTAHVAGSVDPGAVSSWVKVAVAAATVAIAGGSATEHRAPAAPSPPAATERSPAAHGTTGALPPGATGTRAGRPAAGAAPAAQAGRSTPAVTSERGAPNAPGATPSEIATTPGDRPRTAVGLPQAPSRSSGDGVPGTVAPVTVAPVVGEATRGGALPGASSSDRPRRLVPSTGGLPDAPAAPVRAPAAGPGKVAAPVELPAGTAATADDGGTGAADSLAGSTAGAVGAAGSAAPDPAAIGADGVRPRVSAALPNSTAAPEILGG